jgi:hypothetical protein
MKPSWPRDTRQGGPLLPDTAAGRGLVPARFSLAEATNASLVLIEGVSQILRRVRVALANDPWNGQYGLLLMEADGQHK